MNLLDPKELKRLLPAETHSYAAPIPTQSVSSDEFMPRPQTQTQRRVEARIKELGGELARKQGMTRRRFFQTASGMAAAFLVMNEVYGPLYEVSRAEAQTPDMAKERAQALSKQFVAPQGPDRQSQPAASSSSSAANRPPRLARSPGVPSSTT